jgi:hypothetical protein
MTTLPSTFSAYFDTLVQQQANERYAQLTEKAVSSTATIADEAIETAHRRLTAGEPLSRKPSAGLPLKSKEYAHARTVEFLAQHIWTHLCPEAIANL